MIVYFSTVVRAAPQEKGGELVKLDWDTKRVLARTPIVPTNPSMLDRNSRGSTRGGRGILVDEDYVYVASYHSILVFDHQLTFVRQISHPLCVDIHEIAWDGQAIWAASTSIDAAIKIDLQGKTLDSWWPREDPVTAAHYNLVPLEIDKEKDNRTAFVGVGNVAPSHVHLNAMVMQHKRPLVLLNRLGSVIRLYPTEILVNDPEIEGCHNILVASDGSILINTTVGRALHVYSATTGRCVQRINLLRYWQVRKLYLRNMPTLIGCWFFRHGRPMRLFHPLFLGAMIARPIFVRGLCETSRHTFLVGISPASILEIDKDSGKLLDMYTYARDRHVCVHGLAHWHR